MKSFGKKPAGLRLERMRGSKLWAGESSKNIHPIQPGLRDATAPRVMLSELLCRGERRVPSALLPALDPLAAWAKAPDTDLRATWRGHSAVLMPRLGEAVEPSRVEMVAPWWREVDVRALSKAKATKPVPVSLPKEMPCPVD